ncbi:MAG: ABC transporter substrate-binding protein [Syntrophomonadaceae bacterium]|nr:ABC transporter substrate-binding protein [Syntrophomonadaceae bacterium]
MKKWIYLLVVVLGAAFITWIALPDNTTVSEITLINPTGPAVIPVVGIEKGEVTTENYTPVNVQYWKNSDEAVALLASQQADFAVLPITTAANIYSQGVNITLLGVHEWKVFYLLARDGIEFDDWTSLAGKRVYTPNGRGQTADVLIRSGLSGAGLDPDSDVQILYAPPQEVVALFKAGKSDFVALPEPFASLCLAGGNCSIVLDFQEYWGEVSGMQDRIPIAGLFVTDSFLKGQPKKTAEIANLLDRSTNWANENVDKALELSAGILTIPAPIMKTALSRIDFHFVATDECQEEVHFYLTKMKELYPEGISEIPDKEFYAK